MLRIEGYISKKTIKNWLNDYKTLAAGDRPIDAMPSNSGQKPEDGVTATRLNKLMLDDAIKKLPRNLKLVVFYRWILCKPLGLTLRELNIRDKKQYYKLSDDAVEEIYKRVNGMAVGFKALHEKIVEA